MTSESPDGNAINIDIPAGILAKIVQPPVEIAVDGLSIFRWGDEELQINTVGASNAILVRQRVGSSAFENYSVDANGGEILFGTKCKTISKLLNAASRDDIVSLTLSDITDRMRISFADVNYEMAGVDVDAIDEPDVPDLEYGITARIHSHVFERAYQIIGLISESVHFEIENNTFQISGKGDTDIANLDIDVVRDPDEIAERDLKNAVAFEDVEGFAEANYGSEFINYLNMFTPNDVLQLSIGEDYPMRVIASWQNNAAETEVVIAPKMESY